jgi:hypothetical protein
VSAADSSSTHLSDSGATCPEAKRRKIVAKVLAHRSARVLGWPDSVRLA